MSRIVTFTLAGIPAGKGRPRFGQGRAFTDEKTRILETSVRAAYLAAGGAGKPAHDGPVAIAVVATFAPAPSWPKWQRSRALTGHWPHTTRPDLDNIVKAVCDGLNGRAYRDDAQIERLIAVKQYGETPSTTVTLTFEPTPGRTES